MASIDLSTLKALHQAGRLDEALHGYQDLLKDQPENVSVLHLLGILYVEKNELDEAQICFKRALQVEPNNPVLLLHLANVLKHKNLFVEAEQLLLQAIHQHPEFAALYNNLGTLYFSQSKWQLAVDAYQAAITKQANYVDAYYNLGLALNKLEKVEEAKNAFQALVALSPEHVGGHFHLGCLLMKKQQHKEALVAFNKIIQLHPYHFETLVNMGACSLRLNLLEEAKNYYKRALDIKPTDTYVLFNLGVLEVQEGHSHQAIDYYLRAIAVDPHFYPAHYNAAVSYLAMKNHAAALHHFQVAERLQPSEAVRHLVNILLGAGQVEGSPAAYIQSLFDAYADHYDQHMLRSLHYQVPLLFNPLIDFAHDQDKSKWNVLDIGCGTGLCGEYIKPISQRLVGIDLSAQMLAMAHKKHIYDDLICIDAIDYLKANKQTFDMVLAGDLLVYFGNLSAIFSAVLGALKSRGWFLFNVEVVESGDYQLNTSGRFAHTQEYVDRLAGEYQFTIEKRQSVILRMQDNLPVTGLLYLLRAS